MLAKVLHAGIRSTSFGEAEVNLFTLANLAIRDERVRRACRHIGDERIAEHERMSQAYARKSLPEQRSGKPANVDAPAIACVMGDGGRMQVLDRDNELRVLAGNVTAEVAVDSSDSLAGATSPPTSPPDRKASSSRACESSRERKSRSRKPRRRSARKGEHWKESRIGLLARMSGAVHAADPQPQLPAALRYESLAEKLGEIGKTGPKLAVSASETIALDATPATNGDAHMSEVAREQLANAEVAVTELAVAEQAAAQLAPHFACVETSARTREADALTTSSLDAASSFAPPSRGPSDPHALATPPPPLKPAHASATSTCSHRSVSACAASRRRAARPRDTENGLVGPTLEARSVIASRLSWDEFGALLASQAWYRGFAAAPRKAFVSDGSVAIETMQQRYFSNYTSVLDLLHALSYALAAARAVSTTEAAARIQYDAWAELIWSGRVARVIEELTTHATRLGSPDDASDSDPRAIVAKSRGYFTNHQSRMNYPAYRLQGFPLTSSLMESTVKQINRRVKGSEKYWSTQGAEAMLRLRGESLSDDAPLHRHLTNRPLHATGHR